MQIAEMEEGADSDSIKNNVEKKGEANEVPYKNNGLAQFVFLRRPKINKRSGKT